ncbi:MAG: MFS transporter [Chloroflexi bacterium]|nr:MFS transporter [Chloroflexota bacterium]
MSSYSPEVTAYLARYERRNLIANFLDLTFFSLAMSFIFASTVLTVYISRLTSVAVLIGLVTSIQGVSSSLPQLFFANKAEHLSRYLPFILPISTLERLPYGVIGLMLLLWPQVPNWLAYTVLILGLAIAALAGGICAPAWRGMIAKVVHREQRGMLFGVSAGVGGLLGVAGAAVSRQILANYPYPTSYGICFMLCFVFQICSYIGLSLNREPATPPTVESRSARDYWSRLPSVLRGNRNFRCYLTIRVLLVLAGMAGVFTMVYARQRFEVSDSFAADLTMVALISQTIAAPLLGRVADRLGYKWLLQLGTLTSMFAMVILIAAPAPEWFYLLYLVTNAGGAGMGIAASNLPMEFSATELPTYTALSDTLLTLPILLSPLIGGWLVDTVGMRPTFVLSLVLYAVVYVMLRWFMIDPRHNTPTPEPESAV